ncbi:hypothetical protein ACPC54_18545 [Kitasatospora sp. NPDC094028]
MRHEQHQEPQGGSVESPTPTGLLVDRLPIIGMAKGGGIKWPTFASPGGLLEKHLEEVLAEPTAPVRSRPGPRVLPPSAAGAGRVGHQRRPGEGSAPRSSPWWARSIRASTLRAACGPDGALIARRLLG